MSNQVTIKVDQRVGYGLIAVLAVLGIFVVGWWVGTQLNKPAEPAPVAQTDQSGAAAQPAVGQPAAGQVIVTPAAQAAAQPQAMVTSDSSVIRQVMKGVSPVSAEDVPIGENQPRIAVEGLTKENGFVFDMGQIAATSPTEQAFTIKNIGNAELLIDKASASCGCTVAVVDDATVPPGGSTIVRVTYDPNVNQEQGKFVQKQIQIKSNDPIAPVIEFTIEGDVAAQ